MTYLLLAIASLSLLGASNNIKPTVFQAEGEPTSSEVATSSAETSSSTSSGDSTDTDITDEQESELEKLVDAITNSNWWKGVFAAVIAWLTANGATLLGLAIGLLRQRAKTALAESKYKADVQLIAEKFSVKEDELEKKLDSKLDNVIDTCVKTLKEAGNEKAAAELLAGVSSSNKVDAILKEEESSQEDK